jgi:putative DNA-invertase from lambdoid prophage Rac
LNAGVSKPLGDRSQGAALLAALKPDTVITPKLDRMFRSALDALNILARLKQGGISLHMIDLGGDTTGNGVSADLHHSVGCRRGRARPDS